LRERESGENAEERRERRKRKEGAEINQTKKKCQQKNNLMVKCATFRRSDISSGRRGEKEESVGAGGGKQKRAARQRITSRARVYVH
jgi:hypothetical protein